MPGFFLKMCKATINEKSIHKSEYLNEEEVGKFIEEKYSEISAAEKKNAVDRLYKELRIDKNGKIPKPWADLVLSHAAFVIFEAEMP